MHAATNMADSTASTAVETIQNYFVEETPISEDILAKSLVVIPKNKHGVEGSKDYSTAYALATAALSPKLGAASICWKLC